ncbi:MAG: hypothetical protein EXQ70_02335 [Solirubrobacterales bacterium]|nr:hypothetical protein [Solirubrobacterales bacterium]
MADRPERVEIGFTGGQVVAVRLAEAKLKDLRKQLESAEGWSDLETEDGIIAVDLGHVVFIRVAGAGEQQVGFGG